MHEESAFVKKALQDFLYLERLNEIRSEMSELFMKKGYSSEEEIFIKIDPMDRFFNQGPRRGPWPAPEGVPHQIFIENLNDLLLLILLLILILIRQNYA